MSLSPVVPGFMPGIHVFVIARWKTWMAGTSPAMTNRDSLLPFTPANTPHGRQARKIQQAQGAVAAGARRPHAGRDRRNARHAGKNPQGIRALWLRAGGDAGHRIYRGA